MPRIFFLSLFLDLFLSASAQQQECNALGQDAFTPQVLRNSRGVSLTVLPFGGTAQSLLLPHGGAHSKPPLDILLGFDEPKFYCTGGPEVQHPYFGALIGRVANRIAQCQFTLGGESYKTPCNEFQAATGLNDTLHGGNVGYDRRVWNVTNRTPSSLVLELDSPDGEMGFPSSLHLIVTYSILDPPQGSPATELGAWDIRYSIKNTGVLPTPVAPTNHAYFMLSGFEGEETVLKHVLRMVNGTRYEEVDRGLIPTGKLIDVLTDQTWMDFTKGKPVGENFPLPSGASGYDNAWIFEGNDGSSFVPQADIFSPASLIRMVTYTDAPSLQVCVIFYSMCLSLLSTPLT